MSKVNSLAAGAAIFLTACAGLSSYNPTPWWTIHETAFKSLKPGTTTKEEVRKDIGVPMSESHFPLSNEDVWEYRYLEGTTIVMLAYVNFDATTGVLKSYHQRLDPAFTGGVGGGGM